MTRGSPIYYSIPFKPRSMPHSFSGFALESRIWIRPDDCSAAPHRRYHFRARIIYNIQECLQHITQCQWEQALHVGSRFSEGMWGWRMISSSSWEMDKIKNLSLYRFYRLFKKSSENYSVSNSMCVIMYSLCSSIPCIIYLILTVKCQTFITSVDCPFVMACH